MTRLGPPAVARARCCALIALLAAGPAAAQPTPLESIDPPSKAALLQSLSEGNAAFDAGRFEEALAAYDRARAYARLPDIEYRRANCLEQLERFDEAAAALRSFLELAPDAKGRGRIEVEIARLAERAAERRRARVQVLTRPAGAEVRRGGAGGDLLGTTPLTLAVDAGELRLHLSAEGHRPALRPVQAVAGQAVALEVALEPLAPIATADRAPPPEPPDRTTTWVLLGAGGALAAGAGVLAWLTEDRIQQANDYDRRGSGNTRADLEDLQAPIGRMETAFWITSAAAVGALGTGLVLWALTPDEPAPAARVGVGPSSVSVEVPF